MRRRIIILISLALLSNNPVLDAYDPVTHREISERAAQSTVSSVDRVLKDDLGVPAGIAERFPGQSVPGLRNVQELVGDGALSEDASLRFFNHFHNPLYQADGTGRGPWSQAGLFGTFQSSVLWSQNPNQAFGLLGGSWSWQNARQHYLNALTRARKEDHGGQPGRDTAFAETFEALGRLTHLIQDASVPAHARNDAHPSVDLPFFGKVGNPDWYEEWRS